MDSNYFCSTIGVLIDELSFFYIRQYRDYRLHEVRAVLKFCCMWVNFKRFSDLVVVLCAAGQEYIYKKLINNVNNKIK